MRIRQTIIFTISIIIFFASCEKKDFEIEVKVEDVPQKLVVHSSLRPFSYTSNNQLLYIELLRTTRFDENKRKVIIPDAIVILSKNNIEIDTLYYEDTLKSYIIPYNSISEYPKQGDVFKLIVEKEGYKTVMSETTIPEKVEIQSSEIIPIAFFDEFDKPYSEASFEFTDPSNETNYYEVVISDITELENTFFELSTNNKIITSESYYPSLLEFDKPKPKSLFFSDKTINGRKVDISCFYYAPYIIDGGVPKVMAHYITIHLRNITKDYYIYKTAALQEYYSLEENILYGSGEPVNIYTNIENGYGMFGSYNYAISTHRIEEIIIE